MAVYYNENDPYAAAWLRNLIAGEVIPAGFVDERSICDVKPSDLSGYTQCHFFAGLGGWALALRLAGWPAEREVWTGSCPCQPLSCAGRGDGADDARHLWPAWFPLIRERRPECVFGEQTDSRLARCWLAGVHADFETVGYRLGAADIPAAGVGAPQRRQRLWWVADAGPLRTWRTAGPGEAQGGRAFGDASGCGAERMADDEKRRFGQGVADPGRRGEGTRSSKERVRLAKRGAECMADDERDRREAGDGNQRGTQAARGEYRDDVERCGAELRGLGDSGLPAREREALRAARGRGEGRAAEQSGGALPIAMGGTEGDGRQRRADDENAGRRQCAPGHSGAGGGFGLGGTSSCGPDGDARRRADGEPADAGAWDEFGLVRCVEADGREVLRRVEPGAFPLAHGLPQDLGRRIPEIRGVVRGARTNRKGRLRGYGNAIVPQVAAEFIGAYLACLTQA